MNQKDTQLITNNFEFLVTNCKCDVLLPRLRGMMEIPTDEYKELEGITDKKTQNRHLLMYLMNHGPNTYDSLISALMETRQYTILDILKPQALNALNIVSRDREQQRCNKVFQEMNYYEEGNAALNVTSQEEPLDIIVKLAANFDYEKIQHNAGIPFYNTTSMNRGTVKIINIDTFLTKKTRIGSEVDVRNLTSLFTQIGFFVDVHDNKDDVPTKENIMNSIKSFVNDDGLKYADIAIMFIMSHGGQNDGNDYVYSCREEKVYLRDIEKFFNNENCKYMQNKPKLLFIQACRGEFVDYGTRKVETDSVVEQKVVASTIVYDPTNSDLIIAHSTCPEKASHRDTKMGTWFIYLLCEVFMNYSHKMDVETMLKLVYEKLKQERTEHGSMQTGEFINRTFKNCYLNPGIYRDGDRVCFFNNIFNKV